MVACTAPLVAAASVAAPPVATAAPAAAPAAAAPAGAKASAAPMLTEPFTRAAAAFGMLQAREANTSAATPSCMTWRKIASGVALVESVAGQLSASCMPMPTMT
ncbi:hypothetical protein XEUV683_05745 [Xanthomonas euvesicatoria]|nr:hypothetical protein XEUV685_21880 [Xanthomonas euvesicatoria]KLA54502.1 hypothetical protein XEUV684_19150 [Xanthomonas euvesicatoria]KLA54994.1 hypothetical protein XEUV683_05745 [Xanthomonas euvesicatoria]KLA62851.1 hypothetical protein XEUV695_21770 [Xanthomonas euvesicatoria]KLA63771.1 hypothetical protein XEUV689_19570 [Xanthomonas euvesicatoria]